MIVSDIWDITKSSFIFTFKNKVKILSRVVDEKHAINYFGGLSFGVDDLILDSHNNYNTCYCRKHSYEKPIRKTGDYFSVKEIEIFQIIKN